MSTDNCIIENQFSYFSTKTYAAGGIQNKLSQWEGLSTQTDG